MLLKLINPSGNKILQLLIDDSNTNSIYVIIYDQWFANGSIIVNEYVQISDISKYIWLLLSFNNVEQFRTVYFIW